MHAENSVNKFEAFEMWTLRRMLRVSWVDYVTNRDLLRRAGLVDREVFEIKKKTGYLGHILHGRRYHFPLLILQGEIEEGKRGVSRRRLFWLQNIRQWTGIRRYLPPFIKVELRNKF